MTADRFNRSDLSNQALKAWQNAHPELAPDAGQPRPAMKLCHDYDQPKKEIPMTTPPTLSPAEQFRADMMSLLDQMRSEIEQMHAEITQIRDGLTHAASAPARLAGATKSFIATCIVHSVDDNGRDAYKLRGGCYARNGVRVWPEVLPRMGIGIAKPVPMGITQLTPPIGVLVEMHNYTDPITHETRVTPYKVVGLA